MINKKVSVIIPTLQKNKTFLINLVTSFVEDDFVDEIIIIDNSLQGFAYENKKIEVIIPEENLCVNPSWNLGVQKAKNQYICLANDDIIIPQNFCSKILKKMTDEHGIVGINSNCVINSYPNSIDISDDISNPITLEKIEHERPFNFGSIMFFKKDIYTEIPDDLKIFFGDDWICYNAEKSGKKNAIISNTKIYHIGSLSSQQYFNLQKQEEKIYWRHLVPLKKRLLYLMYTKRHIIIFVLGLRLSLKIKKREK